MMYDKIQILFANTCILYTFFLWADAEVNVLTVVFNWVHLEWDFLFGSWHRLQIKKLSQRYCSARGANSPVLLSISALVWMINITHFVTTIHLLGHKRRLIDKLWDIVWGLQESFASAHPYTYIHTLIIKIVSNHIYIYICCYKLLWRRQVVTCWHLFGGFRRGVGSSAQNSNHTNVSSLLRLFHGLLYGH